MMLSAILKRHLNIDCDVQSLAFDSRNVQKDSVFFCAASLENGALSYCEDALKSGAKAIIAERAVIDVLNTDICLVGSENVRESLAVAASNFYPSTFAFKAAVTGTNGKTSVAFYVQQMLKALHKKALSVGTLGYVDNEGVHSVHKGLTTPNPVIFHQTLKNYADKGYDHLVCEASSHGLDQDRLSGLDFDVGAFTNFTQDHLDYHENMESYFKAKALLFETRVKKGGIAVLNADDEKALKIAEISKKRGLHTLFYGYKGEDLKLLKCTPHGKGFDLILNIFGQNYETSLPLLGEFQVMNVLAALGMIGAHNEALIKPLIAYLPHIVSVPGRMEQIAGGPYYVDYAHTPDALENVLKSAKAHLSGKLHVVFGCGGNRDALKRPLMGHIAETYSDHLYVTDDNPRDEDPAKIRQDILKGCVGAEEIDGRAKAIEIAFARMKKDDILVVAGKGHEQGQIIGDQTLPFCDKDVILKLVS